MTQVKLSKQNDHWIFRVSTKSQEPIFNFNTDPFAKTSWNKKNEKQKDKKIFNVVIKHVPFPKKRPNKLPLKNPIKGNTIIKNSINFDICIYILYKDKMGFEPMVF